MPGLPHAINRKITKKLSTVLREKSPPWSALIAKIAWWVRLPESFRFSLFSWRSLLRRSSASTTPKCSRKQRMPLSKRSAIRDHSFCKQLLTTPSKCQNMACEIR